MGLGLSYALTITRTLSYAVRASTALQNEFNSVERVQEFIGLEQEEEEDVSGEKRLCLAGGCGWGFARFFAAPCFAGLVMVPFFVVFLKGLWFVVALAEG